MAGPATPPPEGAGPRLGTALLGLLAEARPAAGDAPSPRSPATYESAVPLLEAALIGAAREPALLPQLSATLERLGRVPVDRRADQEPMAPSA
jgi:hypothetical protein